MSNDKVFKSFMEEVALFPLCAVARGYERHSRFDPEPQPEKEVRLRPGFSQEEYEAFILRLRDLEYMDMTMWFEDQESHGTWMEWLEDDDCGYGPRLVGPPILPRWAIDAIREIEAKQ